MSMIAKTDAAGSVKLLPEVLAYTSSLQPDLQIVREDLVGSLAHLTMLSRCKIIPAKEAGVIRGGLVWIYEKTLANAIELPPEEDVHMAVEGELTRMLGATAGLLHTGRSRNDQIALDLRLHVREMAAELTLSLAKLLETLVAIAEREKDTILPAYTHRQRAQPISRGVSARGLRRDVRAGSRGAAVRVRAERRDAARRRRDRRHLAPERSADHPGALEASRGSPRTASTPSATATSRSTSSTRRRSATCTPRACRRTSSTSARASSAS